MEDKMRAYMEHLFRDVKPTRKSVELKEEILQNLMDRYQDLIAEGKTEEAAYNISIAGIGDMDELLAGIQVEQQEKVNVSVEELERGRKKSAILVAVAVMLYITCLLPPILLQDTALADKGAPTLMFLMIGAATALLVYNSMSKPRYYRTDDSIVEEFKEWQIRTESERRAFKAISGALWALVVVAYMVISFWTNDWHITWVIFLIGGAIEGILKAAFELRK